MGVVKVILVLLVCSFTAVCQDITINCQNVTAHVGDEISLTCTVSNLNKGCCMIMYKFKETAAAVDDTICKDVFRSNPCKQESRFSCPYTANKAMTTKFKFFLQTNCGAKTTEFSVSTTVPVKVNTDDTGGGLNKLEDNHTDETSSETDKSALAVIIAVISSFIIIIMAFVLKKKKNQRRSQMNYLDMSERNFVEKQCTCNIPKK